MSLAQWNWIAGSARWGARIFGSLVATMGLLAFLGGGFGERGTYTLNPFILSTSDFVILSLRMAACLGLLLAWRWEALGGGIAVVCILIATILRPWVLWAALALTVPGVLYLTSWLLRRPERPLTA